MEPEVIKQSFMEKRSLGRSTITKINYKKRFFLLMPNYLKYCAGTPEKGLGKEKGRIDLTTVKVIENVENDELDGKKNVFQLGYKDADVYYSLFIVAETEQERQEWLNVLRQVIQNNDADLYTQYHPSVWVAKVGRFTCCDQKSKKAPGCQPCYHIPTIPKPPVHVGQEQNKQNQASRRGPLPSPPSMDKIGSPPVNPTKEQTVVALYSFDASDEQDLSLIQGEEYIVLDDSREHWWKARNAMGQEGYIPANYVETVEGLEKYDWYRKDITRQRCEAILKNEGREGCFLVRDSATSKGTYTLSLYTKESSVIHYHIKINEAGNYFFSDKHVHANVPDLIFYHKHNSGGLVQRLRSPPGQSNTPLTVGPGHDRYEIDPNDIQLLEELGSGQFGTVRKGMMRGNTVVAVKMMKQDKMSEDEFIEEARVMQNLQNANLVQLYGICTKKPIYIVTEYMMNGSLLHYLRRRRSRFVGKVGTLLDMCIQICQGMAFLESKSFIHRDLAARNCLVGERNQVKVADFGLARFVLDDQYTSSSGTKFPIKWSPPEVLNYCKFSSKSDVWAFGVLMWEVFTCGEMPYGKMPNHQVVEYVVTQNKRLENPAHCPPQLFSIMYKTWASKPENRPNFETLRQQLDQLIERDYAE
ncbi:tyrosine-protein kinase Tec-like isoform X2 [Lineus longissimus]|uniref:tyrosine-protein kinase Tec-like isoform X2 n=1 Tax=Lineus longissimus TaxID=88925 RepID=UPI00315DA4A4